MPGNLSGLTDGHTNGQTDRRICCKMVTVGRMDQRTHVQVERDYFGLRTDGQPENIMPPAPRGGGLKTVKIISQISNGSMRCVAGSTEDHFSNSDENSLTKCIISLCTRYDILCHNCPEYALNGVNKIYHNLKLPWTTHIIYILFIEVFVNNMILLTVMTPICFCDRVPILLTLTRFNSSMMN